MKISFCSDLHLEFNPLFLDNEEESDILLLVGDIFIARDFLNYVRDPNQAAPKGFRAPHGQYAFDFMKKACESYSEVVMVKGNHEPYLGVLEETNEVIMTAMKSFSNFKLLDREVVTREGVHILGCTLWSKLNPVEERLVEQNPGGIRDYVSIHTRADDGRLRARTVNQLHQEERAWLKTEMARIKNEDPDGQMVVMTHFAPCPLSIPEKYREHKLNAAYASDMTPIMFEFEPDIWLHGHIHDQSDYEIGNTRVMSVTRGNEPVRDFKPGVFEITRKNTMTSRP